MHIDFETYSEANLTLVGACTYSKHPSTRIISMAWKIPGKEVLVWLPKFPLPEEFVNYVKSGGIVKAFNVGFERWIWENVGIPKYGFPPVKDEQWRCTQAKAKAYLLPSSLMEVSKILNLKNGKLDGKDLIEKFSMPSKKPVLEEGEDFEKFLEYNKFDVLAEEEADGLIPDLIPSELKFWQIDQIINRRGVPIDVLNVDKIIKFLPTIYKKVSEDLQKVTQGEVSSVFQVQKIKAFCKSRGVIVPSLSKDIVPDILNSGVPSDVKKVLEARLFASSTSVVKVKKFKTLTGDDGRYKDAFLYHGARTGRATGRGVQLHNMPNGGGEFIENLLEDLTLDKLGEDPIDTLTRCIRALIKAPEGRKLVCSDFSAIEAVVLACLSNEEWKIEVFRTHGMLYEFSAARVFDMPIEDFVNYKKEHGVNHPKRKFGKVLELAMGYAGGVTAFMRSSIGNIDKEDMPSEDEIKALIHKWRDANPSIVAFWRGVASGFKRAILNPEILVKFKSISFVYRRKEDVLCCILPSGRSIYYHSPRIKKELNPWGFLSDVLYYSMGNKEVSTHGGTITENICQAVARDILMYAIYNLEKKGYGVIMHIHDEIVAEVDENFGSVAEFETIMQQLPRFCVCDDGLPYPLKAKGGWEGKRFKK